MSHELLFDTNGNASIVYTGEIPWHGFGTRVADDALTALAAVEIVGSDYEIAKVQNACIRPDGQVVMTDGHTLWCPPLPKYGIDEWRQFGQVSEDYVPISTAKVAAILDAKGDDGAAITDRWPVSTHGIVSGGTRMFFTLDGGMFEVAGQPVQRWVNIRDDKSGGGAFDISVGGTRIVCRNTFEAAGTDADISADIRHVHAAERQVEELLKLIAEAQDAMRVLAEDCRRMAERALDEDDVQRLLARTWPEKKGTRRFALAQKLEARGDKGGEMFRRLYGADLATYLAQRERDEDKIAVYRAGVLTAYERFNSDEENEARGSAWAFFNAVTGYVDHEQALRMGDAAKALYRSYGDGAAAKARAYAACATLN